MRRRMEEMKRGHFRLTDNWPLIARPQGTDIGLLRQYVIQRMVRSQTHIMKMLAVGGVGLGAFKWVYSG